MVEQSRKRRSLVFGSEKAIWGKGGWRMEWKTFLTWDGSGRVVMMTSCSFENAHVSPKTLSFHVTISIQMMLLVTGRDVSEDWLLFWCNQTRSCSEQAPNLDHERLEIELIIRRT